jgi:hypothetical protein
MASDAVTDNRTILTILGDGGEVDTSPGDFPIALDASKDQFIYFIDSNSARTVTLPDAALGFEVTFVDKTGLMGTNALTVARKNSSEKINGLTSDFLCESDYGVWKFVSDGTDWMV